MRVPYDKKYIVDTNVACSLKKEHIDSNFFRHECFVPEEILAEIGSSNDLYLEFEKQRLPITFDVLYELQNSIMMHSESVIDLYDNKGDGDVMIIATVLAEKRKEAGSWLTTEWVVATEDNGLKKLLSKFGIGHVGLEEFKALCLKELN